MSGVTFVGVPEIGMHGGPGVGPRGEFEDKPGGTGVGVEASTGAELLPATGVTLTSSKAVPKDDGVPSYPAIADSIADLSSGIAFATAFKMSFPLPGTTSATATATWRYMFGAALHTVATTLVACAGAPRAAARGKPESCNCQQFQVPSSMLNLLWLTCAAL